MRILAQGESWRTQGHMHTISFNHSPNMIAPIENWQHIFVLVFVVVLSTSSPNKLK